MKAAGRGVRLRYGCGAGEDDSSRSIPNPLRAPSLHYFGTWTCTRVQATAVEVNVKPRVGA